LRKIYGLLFGHPMNVSFIDDYVCGTARPMSKKELDWLIQKKGIKAVLSIIENPLPKEWLGNLSDYKHVQVKNHHPPTMPELVDCVDFLTKNVQLKNKVAVHCAAGKGRTGTVLASYLCATQNLSAREAIYMIRSKRGGSIEKNSRQEEAVAEFCQLIKQKKS